ncbi:MAG: DUF1269 domain-containing protein [Okeania sp. SIO2F4]|uniref:DUF1269 domain-containing protein n=1 Tax=Okeania sp. SIO2F4 TaxID=2607790 RepID=UPI00142A5594|nr:DUF1269 domain-containing protein [Okeania sp. SIO2F4]NES07253.1 DUF1269 domain-containing protein [Okeania sp. SIO2F4]
MATLRVLKFPTADGADQMISILSDLQKQELIKIQDAAIVSWTEGKKKPKTRQLYDLKALGALDGAFWGMLFGIIFFVPIFGMAIGAALGALSASFTDIGINDDFIKDVRTKVTEGTSALFLLSTDAVVDRVAEAIEELNFEIVATNLPKEQEEKLREMFVH